MHPETIPAVTTKPSEDIASPSSWGDTGGVSLARAYIQGAKSDNTRRAYRADWAHFEAWCERRGCVALPAPPETVSVYLADHAGQLKTSTLERRLNAISYAHRVSGLDAPSGAAPVRETLKGIRRGHGSAKLGKTALSVADIRRIVVALPDTPSGARDRAIILIGFAGAFRRSELTALEMADVTEVPEGLIVRVRRSKTDQEGQGQEVGIAYGRTLTTCPVRALRDWLAVSGITEGPLFRRIDRHGNLGSNPLSGYAVDLIVKGAVGAAEIGNTDDYGAHSLRAGHATTAAQAGAEERAIMRQGRWKSERTVRSYIRHGTLFTENSSLVLGL